MVSDGVREGEDSPCIAVGEPRSPVDLLPTRAGVGAAVGVGIDEGAGIGKGHASVGDSGAVVDGRLRSDVRGCRCLSLSNVPIEALRLWLKLVPF